MPAARCSSASARALRATLASRWPSRRSACPPRAAPSATARPASRPTSARRPRPPARGRRCACRSAPSRSTGRSSRARARRATPTARSTSAAQPSTLRCARVASTSLRCAASPCGPKARRATSTSSCIPSRQGREMNGEPTVCRRSSRRARASGVEASIKTGGRGKAAARRYARRSREAMVRWAALLLVLCRVAGRGACNVSNAQARARLERGASRAGRIILP
mmetsp:Transcript_21793/g.50105  ORF Transcript_21793/g.50105 Transcript_21793/m.50105 type:complete len:223 (+) Transcript_21793:1160-1828(+)